MTRIQLALAALATVLVVVLFWLLLWAPTSDEIDEVRAETEDIEAQQQQAADRIASLEAVRDDAPGQEALLAASRAIIPAESALPAFLRQLQQAADEAGVALNAVSPARPVPAEEVDDEELHRINVTLDLDGSYFQFVDFLRRIEDPAITPRAMVWNAVTIGGDPAEHPTLEFSLQGDLFATLPTTPGEGEVPEDEPEDEDENEDDVEDTDVDVDVEEEDS